MELTTYEQERVKHRAFIHWKDTNKYLVITFARYWQANAKQCYRNALFFRDELLTKEGWRKYLNDEYSNPWTIHNTTTLNG